MNNLPQVYRFLRPPKGSYLLFGPRGTGKSTFLKANYPDALVIDLLLPEISHDYRNHPQRLVDVVCANPDVSCVILDEVQKVPELLAVVHHLMEREDTRSRQYILTGSSARKLKRAGVDLGGGRLEEWHLHPFMAAELGSRFDLEQALHRGLLPVVLASDNPHRRLAAYISLYLHQEVQAEGLLRNITAFSRFLEAISFSHGSQLNISSVARECGIERKTVEGYVQILVDLLLGYRLEVFTRRARRKLVSHPKMYLMDAGVFTFLRPRGPMDSPEAVGGVALEGLVAQHLKAWIDYRAQGDKLYFWRTMSGVEVDFVVYGPSTFLALEVKASRKVSARDTRSLRAFATDYPEAEIMCLYGGETRILAGDVPCIPVTDYLLALRP